MTSSHLPVDDFLEVFFGDENGFSLGEILEAPSVEGVGRIRPWLERLSHDAPIATVLPRWHQMGNREGQVDWYGLAFSRRQFQRLGADLTAFVGPTYSTFRGYPQGFDSNDAIDRAVLEFTQGHAFKFSGDAARGAKEVWRSIERWRTVSASEGTRQLAVPRGTAQLLRDFYAALQAGHGDTANTFLRLLREENRLDARNLLFLRVQMLAALAEWEHLLGLPELLDLLNARRPTLVTDALLRALYHVHSEDCGLDEVSSEIADRFREVILPQYQILFQSRGSLKSIESLWLFMLHAVSATPPDYSLREDILAVVANEGYDIAPFEALAGLYPGQPSDVDDDALNVALNALQHFDYDRAFALADGIPDCISKVSLLFRCSYELQSLDAQHAAVRALDGLTPSERDTFLESRFNREYLQQITGTERHVDSANELVPRDWASWIERLNNDPLWDSTRALEIARQGAREWSAAEFRRDSSLIDRVVAAMHASRHAAQEETLYLALPHLIEFLYRDQTAPTQEMRGLYNAVAVLLVMSTNGGRSDLALYYDLTDNALSLGIDPDAYRRVVRDTTDLWDRYASPSAVDWAFDMIDLLILHPCPDSEERVNLLAGIVNHIARFKRRIDQSQWSFLGLLCSDLGQNELYESLSRTDTDAQVAHDLEDDPLATLGDCFVGIYTLTERSAKRVRDILVNRLKSVRVEISSDLVASDRLRSIARNADVFVMVTHSATHAATGFIEANRPKGLPLLRPEGRGSASILRALGDWASETAT